MADRGSELGPDDPTMIQPGPTADFRGLVLCNRYRLQRLIGAGGMAQVWEAHDRVLGREVAVKLLHPHLSVDRSFVSRFRAEAISAARLSHQNIVGVFDTCSDGVHEAIIMELLEASTLRRYMDENPLIDAATTIRIALRVLDALEAAHRAGLVHRDIKPSNILLCNDGRVKIADFGIAKADDQTELTQEGSLVGTAAYLSPEQLRGEQVDGRSDLYSLGVVIYECLTGSVPFQGDSGTAIALARLHSDPIDPRKLRADVPPRVADAVMRALERDPDARFDSAADLRAALLDSREAPPTPRVAEAPLTPDDFDPTDETFSTSERHWLLPALFILLVASALIVTALLARETTQSRRPSGTTNPTEAPTVTAPRIVAANSFDPEGDQAERDSLLGNVIDSDNSTAWSTEGYDPPGFSGGKSGVGLVLDLAEPSRVDTLHLISSNNGWSGEIYVVDSKAIDNFVPSATRPVGTLEDVRANVDLDLREVSEASRTGTAVLIWFTNLGAPSEDGRMRIKVFETSIDGSVIRG